MFPKRSLLRISQTLGAQIRTPAVRSNIRRRFASTNNPPLTGTADNAFNRERQAVKAHAAATSGQLHQIPNVKDVLLINFRPLAETVDLVPNLTAIYREMEILTFASVTIPCLIIAGVNAYALWTEHWEHEAHMPPLEERPQYSYMNIRTKKFPWGDGDKVSLVRGLLA